MSSSRAPRNFAPYGLTASRARGVGFAGQPSSRWERRSQARPSWPELAFWQAPPPLAGAPLFTDAFFAGAAFGPWTLRRAPPLRREQPLGRSLCGAFFAGAASCPSLRPSTSGRGRLFGVAFAMRVVLSPPREGPELYAAPSGLNRRTGRRSTPSPAAAGCDRATSRRARAETPMRGASLARRTTHQAHLRPSHRTRRARASPAPHPPGRPAWRRP
jgi:hypothetical protein